MTIEENRRKITNIAVEPNASLRLAIPFFALLAVSGISCLITYLSVIRTVEEASAINERNLALMAMLGQTAMKVLQIGSAGLAIQCVMALSFWFIYSARIFGPTVAIRRMIGDLRAGKFGGRMKLRKRDEFQSIANDLNDLSETLKNQRGQSIIQALVSIAIMAIGLTIMMTMHQIQSRENRALSEKQAALDFERFVSATIMSPTGCDELFNPPNLVKGLVDLTIGTLAGHVIDLKVIKATPIGPILAEPGKTVSTLSNTLLVNSTNGMSIKVTSKTTAELQVNFNQPNLVRPIHDLKFPIQIKSEKLGALFKITGCTGTKMEMRELCSLLNYTFDDVAVPAKCTMPKSDLCDLLNGTMNGGACLLAPNISYTTVGGGCGGAASPTVIVMNNIEKTLRALGAVTASSTLRAKVEVIASARSVREATALIFGLGGVDAADHRAVAEFLTTEEFAGSPYAHFAMRELHLDEREANIMLSEVARSMSGGG